MQFYDGTNCSGMYKPNSVIQSTELLGFLHDHIIDYDLQAVCTILNFMLVFNEEGTWHFVPEKMWRTKRELKEQCRLRKEQ